MTNPDCTNRKRTGDCLTRNSRTLCDHCAGLLSDDEQTQREIAFFISDLARKAQRQLAQLKRRPRHCLTLRPDEKRSCAERGLVALCGFCVSSMSESELIAHATAVIERRRESETYWAERSESDEYIAELRAKGVTGIEWNIEYCWGDSERMEAAYLIHSLFQFSKPCFMHTGEPQ